MRVVLGIDEVGRGAWAGPLVVGAAILAKPIDGIKDSKLLSKKQRYEYAKLIELGSNSTGLGWVTNKQIDKLGLTESIRMAIVEAISQIQTPYDEIVIDGSYNFLSKNRKSRAVVNADETMQCVSVASVIAKIARDEYMADLGKIHPEYGFEQHVGYGTVKHKQAIDRYGVTDAHRLSFKPVKTIYERKIVGYN